MCGRNRTCLCCHLVHIQRARGTRLCVSLVQASFHYPTTGSQNSSISSSDASYVTRFSVGTSSKGFLSAPPPNRVLREHGLCFWLPSSSHPLWICIMCGACKGNRGVLSEDMQLQHPQQLCTWMLHHFCMYTTLYLCTWQLRFAQSVQVAYHAQFLVFHHSPLSRTFPWWMYMGLVSLCGWLHTRDSSHSRKHELPNSVKLRLFSTSGNVNPSNRVCS